MQLYMTGRLKSICKFEEKQVADTLIYSKKSICNNEYQSLVDTTVTKKIIYLFLLRYTTEHCSLIHWICNNVL